MGQEDPGRDIYIDRGAGFIGYGRMYGEWSLNGRPLQAGSLDRFQGSTLLEELDPILKSIVESGSYTTSQVGAGIVEDHPDQVHTSAAELDSLRQAAADLVARGRNREAAEVYDLLLARLEGTETKQRVVGEICLDMLPPNHLLARHRHCIAIAERAARIFEHLEEERSMLLGDAYIWLSFLYADVGRYKKALEYSFRATRCLPDIPAVYQASGITYCLLGDWKNAEDYLNRALELSRDLGNKRTHAIVLNNLAELRLWQGELGQATELANESLRLRQETTEPNSFTAFRGVAYCESLLGRIFTARGQWDGAEGGLNSALELFVRLGDDRNATAQQYYRAELYLARERPEFARRPAETYWQYHKHGPFRLERALGERLLGVISAQLGNVNDAMQLLQTSVQALAKLGNKYWHAVACQELGVLLRTESDASAAIPYLQQALTTYSELGQWDRHQQVETTLRELISPDPLA